MKVHRTPGGSADGGWLTLTELGRRYGISAVHTGRLLVTAGLRRSSGEPTAEALAAGLAKRPEPGDHPVSLWLERGCAPHLERLGLVPRSQHTLVSLWADLLSALLQGADAVSVSAEEMADDVPRDLVKPVNRELRQRGCSFRIDPKLRTTGATGPACWPARASDAADPRRYG
ncbi:MAG: hypothetical protein ER33_10045 [Cyanobium sp. CACIAM 14]|nr:MAG: hypothetical protein ER33_10045 [Cyanobium sp. CACIAM 14]